jgi:hypothetical protein
MTTLSKVFFVLIVGVLAQALSACEVDLTRRDVTDHGARKGRELSALVPEYAVKFQDMKVVLAKCRTGGAFVIQRRSDGKELRVAEPRE